MHFNEASDVLPSARHLYPGSLRKSTYTLIDKRALRSSLDGQGRLFSLRQARFKQRSNGLA